MKTQKEKLNKFREILGRYNSGEFLNEKDSSEIQELFSNHPDWNIKKGVGIKKINVITDRWKKKAFTITRLDNSTTDISFIIAARGRGDKDIKRIQNACRYHIIPEILKFKDSLDFNNCFCPITNIKLSKNKCHIDHYNLSFIELFNEWIKDKNINELVMKLNDSKKDNVVYDMFTDESIISEFILFHNKNTHLRAVSPIANLSLLKSNKRT